MPLPGHQFRAGKAQLYPGIGVDAVINAAVVGQVTAGHTAVGRVHNGIAPQGGDIPPPEVQPRLAWRQAVQLGHAFGPGFLF